MPPPIYNADLTKTGNDYAQNKSNLKAKCKNLSDFAQLSINKIETSRESRGGSGISLVISNCKAACIEPAWRGAYPCGRLQNRQTLYCRDLSATNPAALSG